MNIPEKLKDSRLVYVILAIIMVTLALTLLQPNNVNSATSNPQQQSVATSSEEYEPYNLYDYTDDEIFDMPDVQGTVTAINHEVVDDNSVFTFTVDGTDYTAHIDLERSVPGIQVGDMINATTNANNELVELTGSSPK